MAETWFTPKEWKARLVEFAGRRLLRNVANGEATTYDVSRSEGQVSQEGDAFNTKNMNDLEQRISNGFANAKTNIDVLNRDFAGGQMEIRLTEAGKGEYRKKGADTWIPFKADPLNVVLKFAVDCTWDGAGHSYLTCSIDGQTFINHYLLPKSVYDQTFDLAVKGVPASIRIYVKYSWLDTGDHYDATITVNGFNFLNGTYGWNNTDNEKNIRVLLF